MDYVSNVKIVWKFLTLNCWIRRVLTWQRPYSIWTGTNGICQTRKCTWFWSLTLPSWWKYRWLSLLTLITYYWKRYNIIVLSLGTWNHWILVECGSERVLKHYYSFEITWLHSLQTLHKPNPTLLSSVLPTIKLLVPIPIKVEMQFWHGHFSSLEYFDAN